MIFLPKRRLLLLWATVATSLSPDAIKVKKKLQQAFIGRCSSFDTIARTEIFLKTVSFHFQFFK